MDAAGKQIRFVDFRERRSYEHTRPVALHYYGSLAFSDWQELYYAAVKCLYLEFPDIISEFRSTDSKRKLFLRTSTLDMEKPRALGDMLYLETGRSPTAIVYALGILLDRIGLKDGMMRIEYEPAEGIPLPSVQEQPAAGEQLTILPIPERKQLYFGIRSRMYGPFPTEQERYAELMTCLAENYPEQMERQAGKHINSLHRLTLVRGTNYRYFKEPFELPNGLWMDCAFPDQVLEENERYYLAACALTYENVIF